MKNGDIANLNKTKKKLTPDYDIVSSLQITFNPLRVLLDLGVNSGGSVATLFSLSAEADDAHKDNVAILVVGEQRAAGVAIARVLPLTAGANHDFRIEFAFPSDNAFRVWHHWYRHSLQPRSINILKRQPFWGLYQLSKSAALSNYWKERSKPSLGVIFI